MSFNLFNGNIRKIKPVVLIVLDGWGVAPSSDGNAVFMAHTPNIDKYFKKYPYTELIASGESVGLPANEVGNTEVGHLTIGAGRIVLQEVKRITKSIEEHTFHTNQAFISVITHAKQNNSKIHLMGLIGSGNVHSSLSHLFGLIDTIKEQNFKQNLYLHLFTDGRDSPQKQSLELIHQVENKLNLSKIGHIATVMGRFYAMDRDTRWERTKRAYDSLTIGEGQVAESASQAIKLAYDKGQTDEFIEPTTISSNNTESNRVSDNDSVIFFNFRIDRPRQLTMAFVMPNFENLKSFKLEKVHRSEEKLEEKEVKETFHRDKILNNLFFATMTQYQENLPVSAVAFPPETIKNSITEYLSSNQMHQLHMAESEKQRFVTYYFRGMHEEPFPLEDSIIIDSPKVDTYDKKPQMSIYGVFSKFKKELSKNKYNFILINIANPDMVAHSGNIKATIVALEHTDKVVGDIVKETLRINATAIITADHGNAEEMQVFPSHTYFYTSAQGKISTDHSNNPVPFVLINKFFADKKIRLPKGTLSDIAPTILFLLGLKKPEEMTGKSLLQIQK